DYFKAITIDSSFTWPYNNIGMLFRNIKQYSISIVFFNKAIEIDSTFSKSYNNLALNYIDLNEFDEAIIYAKSAIKFETAYSNAYNTLTVAFLMKGEFLQALESISKAIELDPQIHYYYDNRYQINLALKKYTDVKKDLQQLIDWGHTKYICILDSLENI
ncbi:MAG: tetratricopeptide repeat protein, partial [FCB group bacterium]|nr:tetratricopeptide repeat protein [FCB group bacterium]